MMDCIIDLIGYNIVGIIIGGIIGGTIVFKAENPKTNDAWRLTANWVKNRDRKLLILLSMLWVSVMGFKILICIITGM